MEPAVAFILGNIVFLGRKLLHPDLYFLKQRLDAIHEVLDLVLLAEIHLESKSTVKLSIFGILQILKVFIACALGGKRDRHDVTGVENFRELCKLEKLVDDLRLVCNEVFVA